jgi:putative acetyltransferase
MGRVRFRHARPADAERLLAIKQAAIDAIEGEAYTDEQLSAWQPDDGAVEDFRGAVESGQFELLLAEREETIVAYGGLNAPKNRIDAIYVHPEYSGEGIATSLVRQFESRARMGGVPELKIVSSLNARSFYESLGYWDFGRTTEEICGTDVQFAIMRKVFQFGEE